MELVLKVSDIDYEKTNPCTVHENKYDAYEKLVSPLHEHLRGNEDYIENNIVLSDGSNDHREEKCTVYVCTSALQNKRDNRKRIFVMS